MFDLVIKFIAFPFITAFILGFLYYGLWKLIKPTPAKSETPS